MNKSMMKEMKKADMQGTRGGLKFNSTKQNGPVPDESHTCCGLCRDGSWTPVSHCDHKYPHLCTNQEKGQSAGISYRRGL